VAKSTRAQLNQRVSEVYQLLVRLESSTTICQYAADEWGASERQAFRYISKAKELIEQEQKEFRSRELKYSKYQQLAVLDNLFRKAYRTNDWRNCLGIIKEQNTILGVYAAKMDILDAFQKFVEEGILPHDSLEGIKEAIDIFKESAIASIKPKTTDNEP
jgi:hypothetical protein